MATSYEFRKNQNWNLVYSDNLQAENVPHKNLSQYYPISDFTIPILFSRPIVGIYITSTEDPGTWRKAGYARQSSATYIDNNTVPNLAIKSQKLFLRNTTVCFFEALKETYSIDIINIPFWLREISFKVWEYTGIIEEAELKVLEDKIDLLL